MLKFIKKEDQILFDKVLAEGQDHVFQWWDELSGASRQKLLTQLRQIDFHLLGQLNEKFLFNNQKNSPRSNLKRPEVISLPTSKTDLEKRKQAARLGEDAVRAGRVGVFLVAGGQGSRLGYEGPKGCYPIGPISRKSLFQMHAEKIIAAMNFYGVSIPWYIMTSTVNDEATRQFFTNHDFFKMDPKDVFFTKQRMLPTVDNKGKLILDDKDHIFMSPNGHGGALLAMMDGCVIQDTQKRGIDILSYFQVDNVLINIIDPVFIGLHIQANAEMSSKMLRKRDAYEKIGHFGIIDGRLHVIEYCDMSEADMTAQNPDGSLKYGAGNPAIHLICPDFVRQKIESGHRMPYHMAHKKIPYLSEEGIRIKPQQPNGYKFETFIFDALKDTTNSVILEVDREKEFSPVKNIKGIDSPMTAWKDLANYFGEWIEEAGVSIRRDEEGNVMDSIEISPLYAKDKKEFIGKVPADFHFNGSLLLEPE